MSAATCTAAERLKYARACNLLARREMRKIVYELLRIANCGVVCSREQAEIYKLVPTLADHVDSLESEARHLRALERFVGKPPEKHATHA